ncbi:hypothetical protein CASFOL_035785 [Castilleja foliolosa]|uniref:Phytocyanin domain-containing protein n=1 Tax=Castilleja foliolosa TaxID=1961234 RepID=A0ABD3BTU0_9LAMI
MAQVRGSADVAATAVIIMVTMSSMLFQSQVAEAASHDVKWGYDLVVLSPGTYRKGDTISGGRRDASSATISHMLITYFKKDAPSHDVVKVKLAADYNKCVTGGAKPFFDHSAVTLESGDNYFICSIGTHCSDGGMKIKIHAN